MQHQSSIVRRLIALQHEQTPAVQQNLTEDALQAMLAGSRTPGRPLTPGRLTPTRTPARGMQSPSMFVSPSRSPLQSGIGSGLFSPMQGGGGGFSPINTPGGGYSPTSPGVRMGTLVMLHCQARLHAFGPGCLHCRCAASRPEVQTETGTACLAAPAELTLC